MSELNNKSEIVIIGAGPAGLTAAYELSRHGIKGTIFEADALVGGISRTERRDGYRFDIGGHRFYTKIKEIEKLWVEMMPEPMLARPRLSRIYYWNKFYSYPIKAGNALSNMGVLTAMACMASYGVARMRPIDDPQSFEEWAINQFGYKLYSMFFKTYSEKVWGIPCSRIGVDFAAQRIKGLSLGEAIRNALFGQKKGKVVKTLIDQFLYPRFGPGQMYEACADAVVGKGWTLQKDTKVTSVITENNKVVGVRIRRKDGPDADVPCSCVLSSMPLRELVLASDADPHIVSAASGLVYRDFLTVSLILDAESVFPDNWIYVHSPEVQIGRIQNFKNWSPDMVPDQSKTCLGLEYFCNEGDEVWSSPDKRLIELGYRELGKIGLAGGELVGGYVVRVPKAYPVYDNGFKPRVAACKEWASTVEGLYCIGRNGQHRYNGMDHSMMTGVMTVRNIVLGEQSDPWSVNEDPEYAEIAEE